jgi:RNA polymerase-binding transcription factor DksA
MDLRQSLSRSQENLNREALEEQPGFSTHMADAGTDTFDRDFALGMLSTQQDAIYEIELALERIRNGTYGICELTGRRIEKERLDAIPWARFSVPAEMQLEQEGQVKRAGLGPRETVAKSEARTVEEDEE